MAHRRSAAAPSQRQLRIGELVRHALADILLRTDIDDPELAHAALTVSEVRVSPDGRNASVFVIPLGGERGAEIVAALGRHARFLRGELARAVHLKYTPHLSFHLDTSFDEGDRIDALLRSPRVARDLKGEDERR